MAIPPIIMAVAASRSTRAALVGRHFRNTGKTLPRIREYIKTKMGRLLRIVDTRDTGPLSIAQKESIIPMGARVSLKLRRAIAEFRRFIERSSWKARRRIETSKKSEDIQNAPIEYIFQKEI